jgi:hypothetical protein
VLRYLEQQQAYLTATAAAAQQPQPQQLTQQVQAPDPASVSAALSALHGLLNDPQLLVDMYVNFDCDLQAANLFERTVQVGYVSCACVRCIGAFAFAVCSHSRVKTPDVSCVTGRGACGANTSPVKLVSQPQRAHCDGVERMLGDTANCCVRGRCPQVLAGLAAMTDSELDVGSKGDKHAQETLAGYVAVRKEALSCCLQVGVGKQHTAQLAGHVALMRICFWGWHGRTIVLSGTSRGSAWRSGL